LTGSELVDNLWIGILGPWNIRVGSRAVLVPRGQLRILLASLLLSVHEPVPVSTLVERGWPERSPRQGAAAVHTYATRLRKLLGPGVIETARGSGYLLRATDSMVDLHQSRALLREAESAGSTQGELALLQQALRLWRGRPFGDEASTWLDRDVVPKLTDEWLIAMERRLDLEIALDRPDRLVPELWDLTERYPTRESLWARLITVLHRSGRRGDALDAYQRVRGILRDELGLDPSEQLTRLQRDVLLDTTEDRAPVPALAEPSPPRQLPHDIATVVGRDAELVALNGVLDRDGGQPGTPTIVAIDGTPGAGKTTLAVHWAHQLAYRYPDVQLHLNLRGYGPGEPLAPAAAAERLLRALGVDSDAIATGLDERSALLRTALAGRRALLLLDNARDANQVRPLLPSTNSLVVVTSRNQLRGLSVRDGAHRITLDRLAAAPALDLLAAAVGTDRVAAEPAAAQQLVALCDRLPLALAIVAERTNRSKSLADMVHSLSDEAARLDELGTGEDDPQTDLRAALSWSYQALTPAAAAMLGCLGLHPAPDISLETAAALAGLPVARAKNALDRLLAAHLVEQRRPNRYEIHDLIRLYAQDQVGCHESAAARDAAIGRCLDWYLHGAASADASLNPNRRRDFVQPYEPSFKPPVFADRAAATEWIETEFESLRAVVCWAAAHGWGGHAWRTAVALTSFVSWRIPWPDGVEFYQTARQAARACGDAIGEGYALNSMGCLLVDGGDPRLAMRTYEHALDSFVTAGDVRGEAMVRGNLSVLLGEAGDHERARRSARRALDLSEKLDYPRGTAINLDNLGAAYSEAGQHSRALGYLRHALELHRQLGEVSQSASCLLNIGRVHQRIGDCRAAVRAFRQSVTAYREAGNRRWGALVLVDLGQLVDQAGHPWIARQILTSAANTLTDFADPRAQEALGRLASPTPTSIAV
jgi:DNA-binding SARP family transcriptional activator/tetratricopeptide (TPR) repeat protein